MTGSDQQPNSPKRLHERLVAEMSAEFSQLPSGTRLPSTTALKERFGVAYMTVTRALDVLVTRGEIVRLQGKGTFTACREVDTIYFLTPAPSSLWRPEDTLLQSALKAGQNLGIVVRSIYATFSNRPEDIDWNSLQRIPERASVIVSAHWYQHAFQFLAERHCNVVYFNQCWDPTILPEYDTIMRWHHLEMPYREAMSEAVRRIKAAKRRKVMLLHHCVHCATMGIMSFRTALKHHRLSHYPELELYCVENFYQLSEILKDRLAEIPDCDAIIACNSVSATAAAIVLRKVGRHIGQDFSLIALDEHPRLSSSDMPVTVVDASPGEAGAMAVEMLARKSAVRLVQKIDFKVYDRKSV